VPDGFCDKQPSGVSNVSACAPGFQPGAAGRAEHNGVVHGVERCSLRQKRDVDNVGVNAACVNFQDIG
jgi:hypothetical protein